MKQDLGLARGPGENLIHLSDEEISTWLGILGPSVIADVLATKVQGPAFDKSLADIEAALDAEPSHGFDSWVRLLIASHVISVLVVENVSDLPASNVHVTLNYAGHSWGIQPLLLWMPSQSPFEYHPKTNSLDVVRIAPREQLILLVLSKSAVLQRDIRVSWDRFSEIDISKVTLWLLLLFLVCLAIVILTLIPEFRQHGSGTTRAQPLG